MAGLTAGAPTPQSITLHAKSRVLEVVFSDGAQFRIPFELMRVYSPSAEVAGHGPGQEVLQTGQREVTITNVASIGNYAIQPQFSDATRAGFSRGAICMSWASASKSCGRTICSALPLPALTAIRRCRPKPGKAAPAIEEYTLFAIYLIANSARI